MGTMSRVATLTVDMGMTLEVTMLVPSQAWHLRIQHGHVRLLLALGFGSPANEHAALICFLSAIPSMTVAGGCEVAPSPNAYPRALAIHYSGRIPGTVHLVSIMSTVKSTIQI